MREVETGSVHAAADQLAHHLLIVHSGTEGTNHFGLSQHTFVPPNRDVLNIFFFSAYNHTQNRDFCLALILIKMPPISKKISKAVGNFLGSPLLCLDFTAFLPIGLGQGPELGQGAADHVRLHAVGQTEVAGSAEAGAGHQQQVELLGPLAEACRRAPETGGRG